MTRFLIALGLALCPLVLQGQQYLRDRDPDAEGAKKVAADVQQANFHWGSFYLMSHLRLTEAGLSGDLNVPTGETTGGSPTVGVEAPHRLYYVPHRKVIFSGEVIPAYTFFRGFERDGQFDLTARADMHLLLNHLYLDVYVLGSDKLEAYVGDINRLATTKEGEFGASGELKYSSRTSAIFALRKREVEFPEDRYQPEDFTGSPLLTPLTRSEENGRIALHHKTFPMTSLFAAIEVSQYDFDEIGRDSSRRSAGGGALYDSGKGQIRLEAASTRLEFDAPGAFDYDGVTGSLSLARSRNRWTAGVNLAREVAFSVFAGNQYFESDTLNAGISRMLGRTLSGRANVYLEQDEFPVPVGGIYRKDDISFYSVGFTYSFWKLGVGSDVGWYERKSNATDADDDSGIRWLLHLSFTL